MSSYHFPDGSVPVLVSADTAELIRAEAQSLLDYLRDWPNVTPNEVAAMLFRTRPARRHRALALVHDRPELVAALTALLADGDHPALVRATAAPRRVAFVFPGQGSQWPGMGKLYYETSPAFRAEVDRCAEVFRELYDWSPMSYLLDDTFPETTDVSVVQPALFVQMVGLAAMWTAAGVHPDMVVGHSQGEIAAAYLSGVVTLRDAVRVVTARGRIVETFGVSDYSMAVLGIARDEVEALLARHSGWAEVSVVNSAHILAISGERPTVLDAVATVTANGGFAKEIRVAYPAHTSVVCRFREDLTGVVRDTLDNAAFLPSDIACIGATLGERIPTEIVPGDYWYWNLRNPVRFDRAIAAAVAEGATTFVEVAEHPTLLLAIQENLAEAAPQQSFLVTGTSRRSAGDLREFTRALAGVAVGDTAYPWTALCTDEPVGLPLRDFPPARMQSVRLWAELEPVAAVPVDAARSGARPDMLVERWQPLLERSLLPARTILVLDLAGDTELSQAVCAAADAYRATASVFDGDFETPRPGVTSVLVVLPAAGAVDGAAAGSAMAEFLALRHRIPVLAAGTDYWLLTIDGERVVEDEVPQLFPAAAAAAFRAIAAEHPADRYRHLDLSSESNAPQAAAAVVAALHVVGEAELAYRGRTLYAKRLVRAEPTAAEPDLRHVVIVGGTGQIGLEFCDHLVRRGAARVTLLSRSGETPAVRARLAGVDMAAVAIESLDVTDEAAVARWARDSAPASLLVHAAVNYVDVDSDGVEPDLVRVAFESKVIGIENVLRHLPRTPACRVLLCSSAAATFGARGQLLYAAANRVLDAMALRLTADGVDCRSVQWGLWQVQGLLDAAALAKVTAAGMLPMDPVAAIEAGLVVAGNTVVAAADWPLLAQVVGVTGHTPLPIDFARTQPPPAQALSVPPAALVRRELAFVMGVTDADSMDGSVPLVALGLDSLQALDLRKRIEMTLHRELPVAAVLGGASLDDVIQLMSDDELVG